MTAASAQVRRPPGRPRSAEADEAILDATLELFADAGLEGLTVEGVAARAGVGKATVYRRYPGKLELVVASLKASADVEAPPPDTGAVRGDLRELVDTLIARLTGTAVGRAMPMLVAEAARGAGARRRAPGDRAREAGPRARRGRARRWRGAICAPASTPTSWSTRASARSSTGSS